MLSKIADHFRPYREECLKSGLMNPKVLGVDIIDVVNKKMDITEKKYPVEKAKGVSTKYDKL